MIITNILNLFSGFGNFEPPNDDHREGPGEYGEAYHLPSEENFKGEASEMEYGMNIHASSRIAMDRAVKDTRLEECKHWNYPYDLPKTSVIIVFHNEGLSVLMRTVHSVINRSPKHVLQEVLLVDDFSEKEDLKEKLDEEVKSFNGLVRLIRNEERGGLSAQGLVELKRQEVKLLFSWMLIVKSTKIGCHLFWLLSTEIEPL